MLKNVKYKGDNWMIFHYAGLFNSRENRELFISICQKLTYAIKKLPMPIAYTAYTGWE